MGGVWYVMCVWCVVCGQSKAEGCGAEGEE